MAFCVIFLFASMSVSIANTANNTKSADVEAFAKTMGLENDPCSGIYYKCESDKAQVETDIANNCGLGTDIIIIYIDC